MAADRIPCINPRCRRTAAQDKFPDSDEIICGKCFATLPQSLRRRHKTYWRRVGQTKRLIAKATTPGRLDQIARIDEINQRLGYNVWRAMRAFFEPIEKPAGLDTFLEEMGL